MFAIAMRKERKKRNSAESHACVESRAKGVKERQRTLYKVNQEASLLDSRLPFCFCFCFFHGIGIAPQLLEVACPHPGKPVEAPFGGRGKKACRDSVFPIEQRTDYIK